MQDIEAYALMKAYKTAEEKGSAEYPPCDAIWFVRGDYLKSEMRGWASDDEYFQEGGTIDGIDDEGIYLWGDFVDGPYYSLKDFIIYNQADSSRYRGYEEIVAKISDYKDEEER